MIDININGVLILNVLFAGQGTRHPLPPSNLSYVGEGAWQSTTSGPTIDPQDVVSSYAEFHVNLYFPSSVPILIVAKMINSLRDFKCVNKNTSNKYKKSDLMFLKYSRTLYLSSKK